MTAPAPHPSGSQRGDPSALGSSAPSPDAQSSATQQAPAAGSAPPSIAPGSARAWVLATRPATLIAAVVPVAVGTACAHAAGSARLLPALAAGLGAVLLQMAANFANDVFDYEKGADSEARLGPTRAVQAGLLRPGPVRVGIGIVLALALLVGVYLTAVAGWVIVVIGLASMLAALAYTAGPYPLGYHGLGDVFVLTFFGFVAVCGTAFVQVGHVPELAWWAAAPIGALATGILTVNNIRDRQTDLRAGKRTLAVRLGRAGAVGEYGGLLAVAYAVPPLLAASGHSGMAVLLPLLSAPLALRRLQRVRRDHGRALNASLVGTAQLLLVFGALFTMGIVLGAGG